VEASAELDHVRRSHAQECEELKQLLSDERERSAKAAVDQDTQAAASQRRWCELEESLHAARDQSDRVSKELAFAQAKNEDLTAQLLHIGIAHEERCNALAASMNAAQQEHCALRQQLEAAVREVAEVERKLQGSVEREAAACARASAAEAQLAACAVEASAELDHVRRSHAQECEELKQLLSDERDVVFQLNCQLRYNAFGSNVLAFDSNGSSGLFGSSNFREVSRLHHLQYFKVFEKEIQTDASYDEFELKRYRMQVVQSSFGL
jgi:chromosome segregation ATPase